LVSLKSPENEMREMVRVACPVLVMVTAIAELLWPTIVSGKGKLVGLSVTAGVALTPVPESGTICGLLLALSAIVTAPLRAPRAVGVKMTLMEQFCPALRDDPQLLVSLKSPEIEIREIVRVACPVLVIVTAIAELLWPTTVSGKDKLGGFRVTAGSAP
jgi:hypothetical protein